MNLHDFIFSNRRWHRVSRHICFWLGWFLFSGIVQISFTGKDTGSPISTLDMIFYQFVRSLSRLPGILLFCYFVVYFLVPRFTKRRKIVPLVFLLLLSLLSLYIITFGSLFLVLEVFHLNPFIRNWPE